MRTLLIMLTAALWATAASAEKTERQVAFRTSEGRYITAAVNGRTDTSGTAITSRQKFYLVDLNGGEVEDGDGIRIRYGKDDSSTGFRSSYWIEKDSAIQRERKQQPSCTFTLIGRPSAFRLKSASGKYVASVGGSSLYLTDSADGAVELEIIDIEPGTESE